MHLASITDEGRNESTRCSTSSGSASILSQRLGSCYQSARLNYPVWVGLASKVQMFRRRCAAGALRLPSLHEGSSTAEACLTNHVRSTLFSCSRERVSRATIRCLQTSEHALSSSSLWVTGSIATAVGVGAGIWYSTQKIDCASGISNVRISFSPLEN